MQNTLKTFFIQDSGAVTVDWVVLSAAIVGLGIATVGAVRTGAISMGGDIQTSLSNAAVASLGELGDDGADPFEYALLYASDSLYSNWLSSFSSWPESTLQNMYGVYADGAQNYLDAGNTTSAGYYIDLAYAMQQTLAAQDIDVPDNGAILQTLTEGYHAATG